MDTKSRTFQYKINMRSLLLNKQLNKMKIIESDLCTFCKLEPETPEHLFTECKHTCTFWEEFLKWWHTKFNDNTQLQEVDILFGIFSRDNYMYDILLNQCLIVAKQSIYNCRCIDIHPSFDFFWKKLKSIYTVEKQIAYQNKKVTQFERKWKNVSF